MIVGKNGSTPSIAPQMALPYLSRPGIQTGYPGQGPPATATAGRQASVASVRQSVGPSVRQSVVRPVRQSVSISTWLHPPARQ